MISLGRHAFRTLPGARHDALYLWTTRTVFLCHTKAAPEAGRASELQARPSAAQCLDHEILCHPHGLSYEGRKRTMIGGVPETPLRDVSHSASKDQVELDATKGNGEVDYADGHETP